MNLYGHAVVADWVASDPRFVLGAMLPDLGKLAGHRRVAVGDESVIAGVGWHHRTDDAFHGSATFSGLCRAAQDALAHAGLPRGAAMAVSHVGLELLIDGMLLDDARGQAAYLEALATDPHALAFADTAALADVAALLQRMRRFGLPLHYRDPAAVARRVVAIVEHRPRLAVPADRIDVVARWTVRAHDEVSRAVPSLLDELHAALADCLRSSCAV